MAFVSFFWAGKKPKDPADRNLKSAIPVWRMSFSEPPFHRLPVTEHLRGTTPKSLASPFLPRCIILALLLVLQCLALLTHPSVPGICALSSGEADATASLQRKAPIITGLQERLQGSAAVPPSPRHISDRASWTQRGTLRGCVSPDTAWSAKGWKHECCCNPHPLPDAPKFLTWKGQELHKSCWCTVGSTQKNKCCEQT